MSIEIKVPSVGESITEVTLSSWLKSSGDYVEQDEAICEIESDKASVELVAEKAGILTTVAEEGDTLEIGAVVASIDPSKAGATPKPSQLESNSPTPPLPSLSKQEKGEKNYPSPAAAKILAEKGVDVQSVQGSGKEGRITKEDALKVQEVTSKVESLKTSPAPSFVQEDTSSRNIRREKMSGLRKTIAKRLVMAKHETAMLTTFNEIDMGEVMDLRKKYKESFKEHHQVNLGFMSFFTKAACAAIKKFPRINAQIDENELVYHDYADIGIAVSTPRGLVVPVVRNAQQLGLADIEKSILDLAIKARDNKLGIDEMQGGTFTITNGGVFGSMLSTPIINYPQSAILGMHNIVERPVARNGQVVIRPVMYVALSYDHRIVDGKESVGFLKTIKEMIEDPARLLLEV